MTQYPSPYPAQPQQTQYATPYGYGPMQVDLLAPARRAGIMMIIVGSLALIFGLCMGLVAALLPSMMDQMPPEQMQAFQQFEQTLHMSPQALFVVLAVVLFVVALVYVILGIFARRGGLGIVVTSIVLTSLTILYLLLSTLGALTSPSGVLGACFCVVLVALFVLQLVWLIQAARASGKISMQKMQYQMQYQQYAQMQQAYGQQGYGYGAPQQYPQQAPPNYQQQQPPPPPENPQDPQRPV